MHYLKDDLFQNIVRHARQTNPFYRRWIPENGPVPILPRRVFQEHNDEILNGHPGNLTTSGSSGSPVRVHRTPERNALNVAAAQLHVQHLGGPLPQLAFIYPHGATNRPNLVPVVTPTREQLEILKQRHEERGTSAVITYPSNAVLLAQAILDAGLDYSFVRRLGLMAECVDPGQLALMQQAFPNAKIWSNYSCMEVGLIGFQCPYEPDFHHADTAKLGIEICDDEGRACEPGEIGHLVLTDYFNFASPLIRYQLGDLAAFGSCPCGKIGLPALTNIIGKVRGCLKHRDGRRIPFIDLSIALLKLPGMRQFQVIQEELERFTVKIASTAPLETKIREAFARQFGYAPRIDFEQVESIPREASGKYFFSICRV